MWGASQTNRAGLEVNLEVLGVDVADEDRDYDGRVSLVPVRLSKRRAGCGRDVVVVSS